MKKTGFAVAALLISAAGGLRADTIFTVTMNTTALTVAPGSVAGPFSMFFQLTDGSGLNDANNTATISNFQFGGGSAGVCPASCTASGGASGNAASSIVLADTAFFNALDQGFTPGSSLSFQVDLTTNVDSGGTPDLFSFSLLDNSGFSLPTLDPTGADSLLTVNLDSASPAILTYGSDAARSSSGGVSLSLSAPAIGTPGTHAVPEPDSLLWICAGLAGLVFVPRRKKLGRKSGRARRMESNEPSASRKVL